MTAPRAEDVLDKDCFECRVTGTLGCSAIGAFVFYQSYSPFYTRRPLGRLAVRCLSGAVCLRHDPIKQFVAKISGSSESLKVLNDTTKDLFETTKEVVEETWDLLETKKIKEEPASCQTVLNSQSVLYLCEDPPSRFQIFSSEISMDLRTFTMNLAHEMYR